MSQPTQPSDESLFFSYGLHAASNTIAIFDELDSDLASDVMKAIWIADRSKPLEILINSPGGDMTVGLGIYDMLKAWPQEVNICVTGVAMSAASVILQAGTGRFVLPNSSLMVHAGSEILAGTPTEVENTREWHGNLSDRMYKIYAKATGKTAKYWKNKCLEDYFMNAQQALKERLIDKIIDKI